MIILPLSCVSNKSKCVRGPLLNIITSFNSWPAIKVTNKKHLKD